MYSFAIVTRILNTKYKKDLRYGVNIWGHNKSPINTKQRLPGMHGNNVVSKPSNYKTQLEARQRLKTHYNITENQFRLLYKRSRGNFINLLERRLMSVIFRLGFTNSIFMARQLVSHKHVLVNDKPINIPSYSVQNGDQIKLTRHAMEFLNIEKGKILCPAYIEYDEKKETYTFNRNPMIEDVPFAFKVEAQHITEWYSRLV